jgi:deoxyribodipyrimidine photolyase-related protein
MKNSWIAFPNQIYNIESITDFLDSYKIKDILLLEHPIYFGLDPDRKINMNKLKLVLHRACFYFYTDYLREKGYNVFHVKVGDYSESLLEGLVEKYDTLYYIDVPDRLLDTRMTNSKIKRIDSFSPNYCLTREEIEEFLDTRKGKKRTTHDDFYKWNRVKWDILMDGDKPEGGKYSYDKYNRSSPSGIEKDELPQLPGLDKTDKVYIDRAKIEIEKEFPKNLGNTDMYVPVTFNTSKKWLQDFIDNRLLDFGTYQDAVLIGAPFMYHSVLSPMINCGLLDPKDIVLAGYNKYYSSPDIESLYSIEGFIRQILGWREWQRLQYIHNYSVLKGSNYYNNNNKLTDAWFKGELGIRPIDDAIKTGYRYGYLHHIIRLMYMSNFMNLCRIHPDEMYVWFMSFPMDSYDWVMIQNVYGMGAGSKDNITKPYITTGNYIKKMSNYKDDKEWTSVWEALYYCFLEDNMDKLMAFPRVAGIMRKNLERKDKIKMDNYRKLASKFIN